MLPERTPLERIDRIDEKLRREKRAARRVGFIIGAILATLVLLPLGAHLLWDRGGPAFLICLVAFCVGLIVFVTRDNLRRKRLAAQAGGLEVVAPGSSVPRGAVRYLVPQARPVGSMRLSGASAGEKEKQAIESPKP